MIMFCSQSVASEDVKRDDQEGSDPDRKIENVEHARALLLTTVETQTTNVEASLPLRAMVAST
jgi:hypothetical protein